MIDFICSIISSIISMVTILYLIETLILICVVIYSNIVNKSDPLPSRDKRDKRYKD